MTLRITSYGLAVAVFAVALSGILFWRASSAYTALREQSAATVEQIAQASDRSNLWFIVMMVCVGLAIAFLAYLVTLRRRDEKTVA